MFSKPAAAAQRFARRLIETEKDGLRPQGFFYDKKRGILAIAIRQLDGSYKTIAVFKADKDGKIEDTIFGKGMVSLHSHCYAHCRVVWLGLLYFECIATAMRIAELLGLTCCIWNAVWRQPHPLRPDPVRR